ncbi:hypothetical protein Gasu2_61480 [Galdieria sulphuraria]|uniref:Uncharacterized protein n=1 Tax=Galdieria sulphuraria TaxID=130081 RepID=M2Y2E2_GALSU|nr:uncharacterized protein Gasu_27610 [Galdieria sulphuraria]EME29979.1 hypothetical protein Gasu_27610 [Galdieria sulphuraria]GJD12037.1 hypothetical protein Gasu2_61480 [Galdieria sulphuraria]|eukprot:XP_005706499.1 hypothetical protein Gasu_27610 [Galdieria sulphuraria]
MDTNSGTEGYAVDSRAQLAEQLHKSEKEYQSLLSYLESQQAAGNSTQRAFLPLGPLVYASGALKPCGAVLVLLGENYFARVTLEQAMNIAHRRIAFIQRRLSELKIDKVLSERSEPVIKKQENEILLDRWTKSMQLLERYMQAEDVVNLCEEYDDSVSKEPVRVFGLKKDMPLRKIEQEELEENVDWSSLLDVSGLTAEPSGQNQKLPEFVWNDLRQLEIAETSSFTGDTVEDSTGANIEVFSYLPHQQKQVEVSSQVEQKLSTNQHTTSGVASKNADEPQSTTSQRNSSKETFSGLIKERKPPSS